MSKRKEFRHPLVVLMNHLNKGIVSHAGHVFATYGAFGEPTFEPRLMRFDSRAVSEEGRAVVRWGIMLEKRGEKESSSYTALANISLELKTRRESLILGLTFDQEAEEGHLTVLAENEQALDLAADILNFKLKDKEDRKSLRKGLKLTSGESFSLIDRFGTAWHRADRAKK